MVSRFTRLSATAVHHHIPLTTHCLQYKRVQTCPAKCWTHQLHTELQPWNCKDKNYFWNLSLPGCLNMSSYKKFCRGLTNTYFPPNASLHVLKDYKWSIVNVVIHSYSYFSLLQIYTTLGLPESLTLSPCFYNCKLEDKFNTKSYYETV
jgi:hypothetical protein